MGEATRIKYYTLPNWYALGALASLENLDRQIKHRREIAKIYIKNLNENLLSLGIVKNCDLSTNVRFPIFVKNRIGLIRYLKNHDIFVSDIWYDAPIAPLKLIDRTEYKGECPKAEIDAKIILNLPTHINVSVIDAEKISKLINIWQNTNQK